MLSLRALSTGISWPLHWMKYGGFCNLKHLVLAVVNLHFDSGADWVSSFVLEHCSLRSVTQSGDVGDEISLLNVLDGSFTVVCSLKLTYLRGWHRLRTGVKPAGVVWGRNLRLL
jgi:hypothetical protein